MSWKRAPQNHRPEWAVTLAGCRQQQSRARPALLEADVAREAGRPVRQARGEDPWEVQGPRLGPAGGRRGLLLGRTQGVLGWRGPRGGKAAESLCTTMGVLSPDTRGL